MQRDAFGARTLTDLGASFALDSATNVLGFTFLWLTAGIGAPAKLALFAIRRS